MSFHLFQVRHSDSNLEAVLESPYKSPKEKVKLLCERISEAMVQCTQLGSRDM